MLIRFKNAGNEKTNLNTYVSKMLTVYKKLVYQIFVVFFSNNTNTTNNNSNKF